MRLGLLAVAFSVAVASCGPTGYEPTNKFDPAEAAFAARKGSTTVQGQAFLRQQGGGVVTCAGSPVILVPSVKYTDEIFSKAVGNTSGGVAGQFSATPAGSPDPRMKPFVRQAQCDAQGNFAFTGVPSGTYWAVANVIWRVGDNIFSEGGAVMKRFAVPPQGNVSVILTQ